MSLHPFLARVAAIVLGGGAALLSAQDPAGPLPGPVQPTPLPDPQRPVPRDPLHDPYPEGDGNPSGIPPATHPRGAPAPPLLPRSTMPGGTPPGGDPRQDQPPPPGPALPPDPARPPVPAPPTVPGMPPPPDRHPPQPGADHPLIDDPRHELEKPPPPMADPLPDRHPSQPEPGRTGPGTSERY